MQKNINYKPYAWIAFACLLSQLYLIYLYRPTANDFQPTRKVSGRYSEGGVGAGAQNISRVNGSIVYCSHSYLGSSSPCPTSYRGDDVVVQLVGYKSFYSQDEVVLEINSSAHQSVRFTRQQMIERWWTNSMFALVYATLSLLCAVGGIYYLIFDRKKKRQI